MFLEDEDNSKMNVCKMTISSKVENSSNTPTSRIISKQDVQLRQKGNQF